MAPTSCRGSWKRSSLPVEDALLDGEAVAFEFDGHSDFAALRTTLGAAQASFVAFDLLQFASEDSRKPPLEVPRAQLGSLVAAIDRLTFSEALNADGAIVFAHACERALRGCLKAFGRPVRERPRSELAQCEEPGFRAALTARVGGGPRVRSHLSPRRGALGSGGAERLINGPTKQASPFTCP
jgi:hypothetical protein